MILCPFSLFRNSMFPSKPYRLRQGLAFCLVLIISLITLARSQSLYSPYPSRTTILALSDKPRENATVTNHIRRHTSDRTVLAYVTPWNPLGTSLAEQFRGKFDIISPAWHTIDPERVDGKTYYNVGGGSTGKADDEWVKRMQTPAKDGKGDELSPVNISPRYVLDQFTADDLLELLQNEELMEQMARNIFNSVMENEYDGAVFECAAVWAIEPLVKLIAEKLHEQKKTLSVVIPALRGEKGEEVITSNKIAIHGMRTLSPLADYTMVMTYDHSGLAGLPYGDVYDKSALPDGSALNQDGVRTPGPNAPLEFLEQNLEQLTGQLEMMEGPQFSMSSQGAESVYDAEGAAERLLVGLPLYGYSYPIAWFDNTVAAQDSVPRLPPASPLVANDNDTDAQTKAREKANRKDNETPHIVPLLRFAGEPFRHSDLLATLKQNKALIRLDEKSQENYFDYVAQLSPTIVEHMAKKESIKTDNPMANSSYFRAYFPSAHTMKQRLQVILDKPGAGIALWDLGQAGEWLLHEL